MKIKIYFVGLLLLAGFQVPDANASIQAPAYVVSDIGIVLCAALVFFMQAGFALIESGMSRSKNAINVIMKNYSDLCVGILVFWAIGFGLMYGQFGQQIVFPEPESNSAYLSLLYQMMFATTAATIMSGAMAERTRYLSYVVAAALVTGLIYPVFGSWTWSSEGWLARMGYRDMAGSSVVHAIGGWCALAGALAIGARSGRFGRDGSVREIPGHNLPAIALGGFILWLGWFGFNAGSAPSVDVLGRVVVNTQLCGAAAALAALAYMALTKQPILMTNTVNAALGGLVASCAGADIFAPGLAVFVGAVSGIIVVVGTHMLLRWRVDDVVSAVPVHAFCGTWGVIAVGLLPVNGTFSTDALVVQFVGATVAALWGLGAGFALFKLVNMVMPLRASKQHEQRGLDFTEHYEVGYTEFQSSITHRGKDSHLSPPAKPATAR